MNVVVDINGRKAIPVRAIPFLTDWTVLNPYDLAASLCCKEGSGGTHGLIAYRLEGDIVVPIKSSWWVDAAVAIDSLTATSKAKNRAYRDWQRVTIQELPDSSFVWRDEFEERFHQSFLDDDGATSDHFVNLKPAILGLDFSPLMSAEMHTMVLLGFQPSEQLVATLPQATSIQGALGAAPALNTTMSEKVDGAATDPCAVFLAMENIVASELSIAFVGDKSESSLGANNLLEISVRGTKKRVPIGSLDLIDKRKGTLNSQGLILLGMATKKRLPNNPANVKKVERLRKALCEKLGIKGDPFAPFLRGTGWLPLFALADNRGAADKRAKDKAEFRQLSLEQMNAIGRHVAAPERPLDSIDRGERANQRRQDFAADEWMQKNGHSYDEDEY